MRYSKLLRRSKSRWSAALLGLAVAGCGGDPLVPSRPAPTSLAIVSGNGQEGKVGDWLEEPFVVRVTDAHGRGVEGIGVSWLASDGGLGATPSGSSSKGLVTRTDADGLTRVYFAPGTLGASTVTARVRSIRALQGTTLTFTADATGIVISILEGWGFCPPSAWCTPYPVPVGTTVEWLNRDDVPHTVTSSSTPDGAPSFDSGPLEPGERFRFVPEVPGTWEYIDRLGPHSSSLTVR